MSPQRGLPLALKRALDVCVAAPLLALLAPLWGAVAVAIWTTMGTPVLFRQRRIGRGARPFTLRKFRTMAAGAGDDGARLTRLGRVLRAWSLDELPQLLNILAGQMSLVGPRPLLPSYLPLYTARQAQRHAVLPGLTGLAQVSGRNALPWQQRLALDADYAERWSLALDLAILLRSLAALGRRHEVCAAGHATMPAFTGAADLPP